MQHSVAPDLFSVPADRISAISSGMAIVNQRESADVLNNMYSFFHFPKNQTHFEKAQLLWLIRLRWAAIILFFLLAAPAYILEALNRQSLVIYIGIISLLFVFNFLTYLIFIQNKKTIGSVFICFQLASDSAALAALLAISGGFLNPFVALFLLNAALGGVLIRGRLAWPFILICHALLVALQIEFVLSNFILDQKLIWTLIAASHILLFLTWLIMRSLGSYLESHFENQSLNRIQSERQNRLRAVGALAAGFSHEFASPLNAAKLRLDRLTRNFEKQEHNQAWLEQAKENLSEAKISIRNCEMVIHAMNASQLDIRDYNIKAINMSELIKDITDSWKEENPQANLQINLTEIKKVKASAINLAQVILNLLDNAFEANPAGLIKLSVKSTHQSIEITVEDEGPGFSEHALKHRGEPFITTKKNGTGLGLYVSEIFAQSLAGQLSIQNKSYKTGAIVTLRWPLTEDRALL